MTIPTLPKTFAIAGAGALAFWVAGMPLPILLGPLFACLAAALAGAKLKGAGRFGVAMRTILGVAVGASITPEVVDRLDDFALSVALVPVFVLVIMAVGYPYFRRVCGFDAKTAYYAAAPGGLQDMIIFGREAGASARVLSLVHATRVLVIVSLAPLAGRLMFDVSLDQPPGAPASSLPPHEMAIMVVCALVGWLGGERIGLFGASILGPLIVTALASLAGLIHARPPAEAIWVAQFFIGMSLGTHYVGITMGELRRVVVAALGYCLCILVLAVIFAEIVHVAAAVPVLDAALAFAPGGQAEMVVLALIAGADMAYVVTIHLVRIMVVILGAPIVARWLR